MFDLFVLTFDIDWAPCFVLDSVADVLIKKEVKATWFITHDSPSVRRLFKHDKLFDFGLHPNFSKNSTQGKNKEEIMKHLCSILPDSKILRTHSLIQSTNLLSEIINDFGIKTDVSLFLPETPNIQPHMLYFNNAKGLLRIPYFWEDDFEMCNPSKDFNFFDKKYHIKGLKIFDFHPMHIYLNSNTPYNYNKLKKKRSLEQLDKKTTDSFINNKSKGTKDLFNSLVDFIANKQKESFNISDIAQIWRTK